MNRSEFVFYFYLILNILLVNYLRFWDSNERKMVTWQCGEIVYLNVTKKLRTCICLNGIQIQIFSITKARSSAIQLLRNFHPF